MGISRLIIINGKNVLKHRLRNRILPFDYDNSLKASISHRHAEQHYIWPSGLARPKLAPRSRCCNRRQSLDFRPIWEKYISTYKRREIFEQVLWKLQDPRILGGGKDRRQEQGSKSCFCGLELMREMGEIEWHLEEIGYAMFFSAFFCACPVLSLLQSFHYYYYYQYCYHHHFYYHYYYRYFH